MYSYDRDAVGWGRIKYLLVARISVVNKAALDRNNPQ